MTERGLPAPTLSQVDDIMTRELITFGPDTGLDLVAEVMLDRGISGAPVVEEGRLVGMVSKTNLVGAPLAEEEGPKAPKRVPRDMHVVGSMTVREIMNKSPVTVPSGASVASAAEKMVRLGVHRLPVVDGRGTLLGIVTTMDVMRWVAGLP